ncbi:MAG: hypothetical protein E6Q67_02810 [Roseateles sp.]|nr:MAG: hypothetical protein E6Q67_02810 [Roseateles sp.]
MALVVGALIAATQLQAQINNSKLNTGSAEGGVLGALADAGNSMVTEQLVTIQQGSPVTKNGVTVTPTTVGPDLYWIVAISDLKAMNYLPSSWNITKSTINNAPYALSFKRSPTGCAPVNCSIDGSVVLTGSINDTGATGQYDSVVVGAILNKLGVRGGVSLPQSPGTITGYGNSWSIPNPVGGTPPGVAAAYFGTTSGTNSQFVRIQDSRNPDLQGPLSVAGNISTPAGIAGNTINATTSVTAGGAVTGATFKSANNCFQVDASGRVGTSCFSPTDMPAGWSGGVSTGDVYSHSNIGVGTGGAISASLKSDGAIRGAAGDFMVANNGVIGLNAKGTSGAACSSSTGNVGALTVDSSGTLLNCVGGVWRPVGGRQQKQTFYIASDGAVVPSPGCPSTASAQIVVVPSTIYVNPTAAISYTGPGSGPWTINIRDGSNAPVPGATAQVETYCAYS